MGRPGAWGRRGSLGQQGDGHGARSPDESGQREGRTVGFLNAEMTPDSSEKRGQCAAGEVGGVGRAQVAVRNLAAKGSETWQEAGGGEGDPGRFLTRTPGK